MSKFLASSPALRFADSVLHGLIGLNLLAGAAMLAMFFLPHEQWILDSFNLAASPDSDRLVLGLRTILVLGLICIPVNHFILQRLKAVVATARAGDPFVDANAHRLQAIAWAQFALQIISLVVGGIARAVSTPAHPLHLSAGFSLTGWLAVLLTFLLASVFAEGTKMRDELEGTV